MRSALSARRTAVVAAVVLCIAGFLSAAGFAAAASLTPTAVHPKASKELAHVVKGRARASLGMPQASAIAPKRSHRLPAGEAMACPTPTHFGRMQCMAVVPTSATSRAHGRWAAVSAAARIPGYTPANLRSAYKLNKFVGRGRGETVAIVDAFRDPNAAKDLARYRSHYHLPACTTGSKCLRIVNQQGKAGSLPRANANWAVEESLDLDMVSAICPRCRILLVEARNPTTNNLGAAENTAIRLGAKFVSNSWSGAEFPGETSFDKDFNHPGVVIDFAAGDFGYESQYPTDSQFVTAVGGTALHHANNGRGWSETAWSGTGSGCASLLAKPSWQQGIDNTTPNGCVNRIGNDVSADAAPSTGVSISDTYRTGGTWLKIGGTSVATPMVTAMYALAGNPAPRTYPASYLYHQRTHFFDVTSGSNGTCETNRQYLCHAVPGYDSPTGFGTPNGIAGFSKAGAPAVTLADPGTQDVATGASFSLRINGADTASPPAFACSATGLPPGLAIGAVAGASACRITGTLPGTPGTSPVTVTATDTHTGKFGKVSFAIVAVGSMSGTSTAAHMRGFFSKFCLDSSSSVVANTCSNSASQNWSFIASSAPGGSGNIEQGGKCLGLSSGGLGVLESCSTDASTGWFYLGFGLLQNAATGTCLSDASTSGLRVGVISCNETELWSMPAGQITSGVNGLCLDNPSNTQPEVATCGSATDNWLQLPNEGLLQSASGDCARGSRSRVDGTAVQMVTCVPDSQQPKPGDWFWGPGGELYNITSGLCLADPGNSTTSPTGLLLEDCYGQPGELWGFN